MLKAAEGVKWFLDQSSFLDDLYYLTSGAHFLVWRVRALGPDYFVDDFRSESSVCNTVVEEVNKVGKGKYKSMKAATLPGLLEPRPRVIFLHWCWMHPGFCSPHPERPSPFPPGASGLVIGQVGALQPQAPAEGAGRGRLAPAHSRQPPARSPGRWGGWCGDLCRLFSRWFCKSSSGFYRPGVNTFSHSQDNLRLGRLNLTHEK